MPGEPPDLMNVPSGCRFHPRCPLAFERCKTEEPPLFDVGGGQSAACWLAEGGKDLPPLPTRTPADMVARAPIAAPATADEATVPTADEPGSDPAADPVDAAS